MASFTRFIPFALLAFASLPLHAADNAPKPALLDDEVRANLGADDLKSWDKLARDRADAERQIARGKAMMIPPRMQMKGAPGESPEALKAKGEALVKVAEERLAELAKSRAELAASASARIKSGALRVGCPMLPLRDAITAGVTDVVAYARKAGYGRIGSAGFVLSLQDKPSRDIALSELLAESLKAAQAASPAADAGGDVALVVAELQRCDTAAGAVLSIRLVDGRSLMVRHATLALVPSDTTKVDRRGADGLTLYVATLEDSYDFLGKLGPAERWTFEVEGADAGACLLKAVLAPRAKPALTDITFLKLATAERGTRTGDAKALWKATPDAASPGSWIVTSRGVAPGAKSLPVGRLSLQPAPDRTSR